MASPAAPLRATGPRESQAPAGLPDSNAADDRLRTTRTPQWPSRPPASPSAGLGSRASKRGRMCCRLPARVTCRSSGAGTRSETLADGWPGRRTHRRRRRPQRGNRRPGAQPTRGLPRAARRGVAFTTGDRPRGSGPAQRTSRESSGASLSHWSRARERSEPELRLVMQCRAEGLVCVRSASFRGRGGRVQDA